MATYEVVLTQQLAGVNCQMAFHYNNLAVVAGVPGAPAQIAAAFGDIVLPTIMALQSDEMANVSVYCRDLGAPATAAVLEAGGTGGVVATAAETLPPWLPLVITFTANSWFNVETSAPYVGVRPGGKGKKYLSGLTEAWSSVASAEVPVALASAWNDFQVAVATPLAVPVLSTTVNHVVYSPAKAALGTLPERQALVAAITDAARGQFTRLSSRRS